MGKKQEKKSAKGRLDKFYWLAKEQGYRARSAFKLVQLNKKFSFLETSKCCIDLCAAPGGWLQVASRNMPQGSLIVGVDLVPIRPIPHCVTFAEDINSYKCRDLLRKELKDWKADVVLHDGAPNVGTAWVQDAYTQNELVLQSLKLAVEFLIKGGVFVTKVFRSKDYNSLIWVFNQLFAKVEATKPPSSRNVSAEIFVVCQDFKAPARIDPKFLDPRHVFKDLEPSSISIPNSNSNAESGGIEEIDPNTGEVMKSTKTNPGQSLNSKANANVFEPQKKRRHREGYADGDYTMFKSLPVEDFIRGNDAVGLLGTYNQIDFSSKEGKKFKKFESTDEDILENCKDLKVLGRKDFRNLIKWRKSLREELGLDQDLKSKKDQVVADQIEEPETEEGVSKVEILNQEPLDPEEENRVLDSEISRLKELEDRKKRKERRKRNEMKQKQVMKLQLKMGTPLDIGMDQMDETREASGDVKDMFSLKKRKAAVDLQEKLENGDRDANSQDEDEDEQESLDEAIQKAQENSNVDFDLDRESSFQEESDQEDSDGEEDEETRRIRNLERTMDEMYDDYRSRVSEKDSKFKVRAAKAADKSAKWKEWNGIKDDVKNSDEEDLEGGAAEGNGNDSSDEDRDIAARGYEDVMKLKEKEETFDTDDEEDEEFQQLEKDDLDQFNRKRKFRDEEKKSKSSSNQSSQRDKIRRKTIPSLVTDLEDEKEKESRISREAKIWFDNPLFKGVGNVLDSLDDDDDDDDDEEEEEESGESEGEDDDEKASGDEDQEEEEESDDDSFEIVPPEGLEFAPEDDLPEWDYDDIDTEEQKNREIADNGLTTAEAITLAQALVNREATKESLIDSGFKKENFQDKTDLPSWFLDDESKHWKANTPITKEAVQALRARVRALDSRPIKKIAEAKARKKMRSVRRLEKAKKKAESLNEAEDVSEREKSSNINKVLLKATSGKPSKKSEKTLVVARGPNRGIKGRPKGAKGRYRMVDRRMKKEIRANKRTDKKNGKKTSSSSKKNKRAANGY